MYTRSGDNGETGLVGGQRVAKTDPRVEAYGEVDELNSCLGVLKESLGSQTVSLRVLIEFIQQELFDIGAELACAPEDSHLSIPRTTQAQIVRLEQWCDHFNHGLAELNSFIVPGGNAVAAQAHICRTVCRRAERRVLTLQQHSLAENPHILCYLNRLSDFFFILARWVLAVAGDDPGLWRLPSERIVPELPPKLS